MRTRKSRCNIINPFKNLDEIVRATGRSWRTVRKRLEEAKCYPLPPSVDRDDILLLMEDGAGPAYTAAEKFEINARINALLTKELARIRKLKGTGQ